MNPFIEAWGFLGGILGFLISIPQLIRVVKNKSQVGVSLTTWLIIMVSCFNWTAYGFRVHSLSQIVTNFVAAALAVTLSFILMRAYVPLWLNVLILASLGTFCSVLVTYAPVGIMDAWLYAALVSRVPQAWASFQSMRLGRRSVVSISTYVLSGISALAWIVYGVLAGLEPVAYFSIVIALFSLLVVAFELIARTRENAGPLSA